jgi:hypothetical protein
MMAVRLEKKGARNTHTCTQDRTYLFKYICRGQCIDQGCRAGATSFWWEPEPQQDATQASCLMLNMDGFFEIAKIVPGISFIFFINIFTTIVIIYWNTELLQKSPKPIVNFCAQKKVGLHYGRVGARIASEFLPEAALKWCSSSTGILEKNWACTVHNSINGNARFL